MILTLEIFGSLIFIYLLFCSPQILAIEKILLQSIVAVISKIGIEEAELDRVNVSAPNVIFALIDENTTHDK